MASSTGPWRWDGVRGEWCNNNGQEQDSKRQNNHNIPYDVFMGRQGSSLMQRNTEMLAIPHQLQQNTYEQARTDPVSQRDSEVHKHLAMAHNQDLPRKHGPASESTAELTLKDGSSKVGRRPKVTFEVLERGFRVKFPGQKFFRRGKVFKIWWSEPAGTTPTTSMMHTAGVSRSGENLSVSIRWFVVIREGQGCCICLPIQTYRQRGVSGTGKIKSHHAIVYTGEAPPEPLPGEIPNANEEGMRDPIRVQAKVSSGELDSTARVNFFKVFTVEHSVEAQEFGDVVDEHLWQLMETFNSIWELPMTSTPRIPSMHHDYNMEEEDPYRFISLLGRGAFGHVDQVEGRLKHNAIFARKLFRLPKLSNKRATAIDNIKKEARIMNSLRHHHIVTVCETYQWRHHFGIIMLPVAESDLASVLEEVDGDVGNDRNELLQRIPGWCACLIQAMAYIHASVVRHKDIKPHNILIKEGKIFLTDFGLAEDMRAEDGSGTDGSVGVHTARYSAPEVRKDSTRRGRSADIFSLGCILLELATVSICPPGARSRLRDYHLQDTGLSKAYSDCPSSVAHWVLFLALTSISKLTGMLPSLQQRDKSESLLDLAPLRKAMTLENVQAREDVGRLSADQLVKFQQAYAGLLISDLAFLMMTPEPSERVTAQHLSLILNNRGSDYHSQIQAQSCTACENHRQSDVVGASTSIVIIYKSWHTEQWMLERPDDILEKEVFASWKDAQKHWVSYVNASYPMINSAHGSPTPAYSTSLLPYRQGSSAYGYSGYSSGYSTATGGYSTATGVIEK